jgi:Protein of unknown function (DUF1565)
MLHGLNSQHSLRCAWRGLARSILAGGLLLGSAASAPAVRAATSTAVTTGDLNVSATFNSIGIELKFTGDGNANASASVQFKRSTDTAWRAGLPLWRTPDAFYGSLLLLDPGTAYTLRISVSDPDGVSGPAVLTHSITTRAENIPAASTLVPTRFVTSTGNDANAGTTASSAWRTLDQAIAAAPAGAVVQVGPGYYHAPTATRTTPVSLVAQYAAVDDTGTVINAGKHAVVEGGLISGPATATEAGVVKAPWQQVSLGSYKVWKWASTGRTDISQLGYASSRAAAPKRVAMWNADSADLATPTGWAQKLYTNLTYNYGFYRSGSDLYLRLPGDLDPNSVYVSAGSGTGLGLDGPDMRVSGLELRQFTFAVELGPHATSGVVDHSLLSGNKVGVEFKGLGGSPSTYGTDHVIQYNRFVDSSLWTADHAKDPGIPWGFIKSRITNADGSPYATSRIGDTSETTAVWGRGGAHRTVIRHNTIDGTFNGVSPQGYSTGFDRYAGQDSDVHDNLIRHIPDDSLEPEGPVINFRAWGNRIEDASVVLSTAPANYGPLYLVRNEGWRISNDGVPRDAAGKLTGPGTLFFKYSGASTPHARVFVLHNTFWSDPSITSAAVLGGALFGGASSDNNEALYLRNNIIRDTNYAFDVHSAAMWDEDYNNFSTSEPWHGLRYTDHTAKNYTTDVAAYRAASGQGAHTNTSNNFITAPKLSNPQTGDLHLPAGSPMIDAGVPVPNISDRPGLDFKGTAPDLGAHEAG